MCISNPIFVACLAGDFDIFCIGLSFLIRRGLIGTWSDYRDHVPNPCKFLFTQRIFFPVFSIHREFYSYVQIEFRFLLYQPKSDFSYHFPIDLKPNGIPLGPKSIGKYNPIPVNFSGIRVWYLYSCVQKRRVQLCISILENGQISATILTRAAKLLSESKVVNQRRYRWLFTQFINHKLCKNLIN